MADRVREPIQVYLTRDERVELDRRARELGVSRSEALRQGIRALALRANAGTLQPLVEEGHLEPPVRLRGVPPRGTPVAPLRDILDELARDRDDR